MLEENLDVGTLKEQLEFQASWIKHAVFSAFMFAFGVEIINGNPISLVFSVPYSEVISGVLICLCAGSMSITNFITGFQNKDFSQDLWVYVIFSVILNLVFFEVAIDLTNKIWN